ncbi:hypothetical protein K491DRAFT_709882 [Lophiostoma macrostomum CBS 122681]|uniref:Uncharacterized protein n=1 Tax=Lophiostoma macrostomum CBS 122681 TaxID=1314788 RepID=A0A6A6TTM4_9PLEO|nr:hypothetical protein K491DRAFT_709882 [Lophiostoma macrostomum CBS 122681]
MDSTLKPPQSLSPNLASSLGDRRSKNFQPLSNHGLPKTPLPSSPGGSISSHRFSTLGSPPYSPNPGSMPMSPKTPLSAKSFSTFIDSEPSTPAYSPRNGHGWDNSTLMLLSPVRSSVSSTPSSPPEPKWEMIKPPEKGQTIVGEEVPVSQPKATSKRLSLPKPPRSLRKKISSGTSLSSHPVKPIQEESQKENVAPKEEKKEGDDDKSKTQAENVPADTANLTAPLEKLATKMKSMLRRKSASMSEKKAERKRRNYDELVSDEAGATPPNLDAETGPVNRDGLESQQGTRDSAKATTYPSLASVFRTGPGSVRDGAAQCG